MMPPKQNSPIRKATIVHKT